MTRSASETNRLLRERRQLQMDPIDGTLVDWPSSDLNKITVEISAPEDSLYHDDILTVRIDVSTGYPRVAPRVFMVTPIFHPNIDAVGSVCIACLRTSWSAQVSIRQVVSEIVDALRHPNPDDELSIEAATMMKSDMKQFERAVRAQVERNRESRGETE